MNVDPTILHRLWPKIILSPTGCWEWSAAKTDGGYGLFSVKGKTTYIHRFMWWLSRGVEPRNLHVRHTCDNPSCLNPKHLKLGTPLDNAADRLASGLTKKGVREIKAKAKAGVPRKELADEYGVALDTVFRIISGRSYGHIT